MITLCNNIEILNKLPVCYETVKIKSLLMCYGLETDFLYFYKQTDEFGNLLSVILRFYNELTVCAVKNSNLKELKNFIVFFGSNFVAKAGLTKKLKFKNFNSYFCLEYKGKAEEVEKSVNLNYKDIYNILLNSNSKDIVLNNFENWYVDYCHRVRHNIARSFSVNKNSVAITAFETNNGAIINGVATLKSYRNKGYGKQNVLGLCNELQKAIKEFFCFAVKTICGFIKN